MAQFIYIEHLIPKKSADQRSHASTRVSAINVSHIVKIHARVGEGEKNQVLVGWVERSNETGVTGIETLGEIFYFNPVAVERNPTLFLSVLLRRVHYSVITLTICRGYPSSVKNRPQNYEDFDKEFKPIPGLDLYVKSRYGKKQIEQYSRRLIARFGFEPKHDLIVELIESK